MRHDRSVMLGIAVLAIGGAAFGEPAGRDDGGQLTYDPVRGWSQVAAPVPGTETGDLAIARRLVAEEEFDDAEDLLEDWVKQYGSGSPHYAEALYFKATAHLGDGDYRAADETYSELLNNYPGSEYSAKALAGLFRVAEQYLAGKRRKAVWGLLRVTDRERGIEIMDDIIINYPDTELAPLAQKAKADYYFFRGEFEMAEEEYATFVREYPRSHYEPYALFRSAVAALASFPGVQFDDAGLIEAEERFRQFVRAYPDRAEQQNVPIFIEQIAARRAEKTYEIAWFYERTEKYPAARYYYNAVVSNWPETPSAGEARVRLDKMASRAEGIVNENGVAPIEGTP